MDRNQSDWWTGTSQTGGQEPDRLVDRNQTGGQEPVRLMDRNQTGGQEPVRRVDRNQSDWGGTHQYFFLACKVSKCMQGCVPVKVFLLPMFTWLISFDF